MTWGRVEASPGLAQRLRGVLAAFQRAGVLIVFRSLLICGLPRGRECTVSSKGAFVFNLLQVFTMHSLNDMNTA